MVGNLDSNEIIVKKKTRRIWYLGYLQCKSFLTIHMHVSLQYGKEKLRTVDMCESLLQYFQIKDRSFQKICVHKKGIENVISVSKCKIKAKLPSYKDREQNSTLLVLKNEIYRPINQKCTLLDGLIAPSRVFNENFLCIVYLLKRETRLLNT